MIRARYPKGGGAANLYLEERLVGSASNVDRRTWSARCLADESCSWRQRMEGRAETVRELSRHLRDAHGIR